MNTPYLPCHIGDHYWIINGYFEAPDLQEQKEVAVQEILNYKEKQQQARDEWSDEEWTDQAKLYEFSLYKSMECYWQGILEKMNYDPSADKLEEIEIPTADLELSPIHLLNDDCETDCETE